MSLFNNLLLQVARHTGTVGALLVKPRPGDAFVCLSASTSVCLESFQWLFKKKTCSQMIWIQAYFPQPHPCAIFLEWFLLCMTDFKKCYCCAKQSVSAPRRPAQQPGAHFTHFVEALHVMKWNVGTKKEAGWGRRNTRKRRDSGRWRRSPLLSSNLLNIFTISRLIVAASWASFKQNWLMINFDFEPDWRNKLSLSRYLLNRPLTWKWSYLFANSSLDLSDPPAGFVAV